MRDGRIERVEDESFVGVRIGRGENKHVLIALAYSAFPVSLFVVDQAVIVLIMQSDGTKDFREIDKAKQ